MTATPGSPAPFTDLPAALVDEVLSETTTVAERLLTSFQQVRKDRETFRKQLADSGLVVTDSSLGYPPMPTTHTDTDSHLPVLFELMGFGGPIPSV